MGYSSALSAKFYNMSKKPLNCLVTLRNINNIISIRGRWIPMESAPREGGNLLNANKGAKLLYSKAPSTRGTPLTNVEL